jgi:multidrug efflux pump subunit AcrA (membrane-fusion protein)
MSTLPIPAGRGFGALRLGVLLAAVSGCAGRPPIDTVSSADTALNQAMNARAAELAPMELQVALDKLNRAKQALADKEYRDARRLAEEARVDAQVAESKAHAESAGRAAREVRQSIDTLQKGRGPGGGAEESQGQRPGGQGDVESR